MAVGFKIALGTARDMLTRRKVARRKTYDICMLRITLSELRLELLVEEMVAGEVGAMWSRGLIYRRFPA